jgi:hypothetical protein
MLDVKVMESKTRQIEMLKALDCQTAATLEKEKTTAILNSDNPQDQQEITNKIIFCLKKLRKTEFHNTIFQQNEEVIYNHLLSLLEGLEELNLSNSKLMKKRLRFY